MKKLLRITTVPNSLYILLKGQADFFEENGFKYYVASSKGKYMDIIIKEWGDCVYILPLTRKFNPPFDLYSLLKTVHLLLKLKPDIVHTHTPKAGLIGMLAAKLVNTPVRLHTIAGLPLVTKTGLYQKLLVFIEKTTVWASTMSYPNSQGLKKLLLEYNIGTEDKLKVIGHGSSNGINLKHFKITNKLKKESLNIRKQLGIPEKQLVFIYIGRIVRDKGINELISTFDRLSGKHQGISLLLLGRYEQKLDPLRPDVSNIINNNKRIIHAGFQNDVRPYLVASNVFVFPSYREGFPNVVLQASAMELPSIVTDINGCNEIIEHEVNGLLIKPQDEKALNVAMERIITEDGLKDKLKTDNRQILTEKFDQNCVWNELLLEYQSLINGSIVQ